ncbi:hypothetical protein Goari_006546 [Gossypium aridum]|uniref:Uncharacterized protein n=1 Tax=Gossypium aridum TaxID=34290 RepID=A0A7J8XPX9_GOSAI|nr:hypothetical protein [Gossypium aridum]
MGSDTSWFIIVVVVIIVNISSSIVGGSADSYDPQALKALFRHYANLTLANHHTGAEHKVNLPSNFTGMEVSVKRLRSGSLWTRGTDSIYVKIPPNVKTLPYVKRLAIVYDNLGNWSSMYYNVPGYSLVSPVIGFDVYNYSDLTMIMDGNLTLSVESELISIHFPYLKVGDKNTTLLKCVGFEPDGSVEFKNWTNNNVCKVKKAGHFCVVAEMPAVTEEKEGRAWKWWVIGFGIGIVGLIVLVSMGMVVMLKWRKMEITKMEKESDTSVALDTFWVRGDHKMPCASMIRTQPTLEHDFVP